MDEMKFYKKLLTKNFIMVGIRCMIYAIDKAGGASNFSSEDLVKWTFGEDVFEKADKWPLLETTKINLEIMIATDIIDGELNAGKNDTIVICSNIKINPIVQKVLIELENEGAQMIPVVQI